MKDGNAGKGSSREWQKKKRRREVHKKLNSMKLIVELLLLGFKRRLQAGAERETAALLFIYLFSNARGCYFTSGGGRFMILD